METTIFDFEVFWQTYTQVPESEREAFLKAQMQALDEAPEAVKQDFEKGNLQKIKEMEAEYDRLMRPSEITV